MSAKDSIKTTILFTSELPEDPLETNVSRQVHHACYSYVKTRVPVNPTLVHASQEMMKLIQMDELETEEFLNLVTGQQSFPGFRSYAMCYGGHQFGNWAGQLGDGRAINVAELNDVNGHRWVLQLKGSGRTPYSRGADGFAVLRSSIREYLCSEAMHHLGVPTTRALSLAITGDLVERDMFYDGNRKDELGAVVCRVSPSFIRFGHFEIFSFRKENETLKKMVDFTIKHHYPYLGTPGKETYLAFFKEVAKRSKDMVVHWQRVGFVHGVMNTDNLSILGLTLDYGPYGWLENYDPDWTPNTTDAQNKRYRYGHQPAVVRWNLTVLANALFPLIKDVEALTKVLDDFQVDVENDLNKMELTKVGLFTASKVGSDLISGLKRLMFLSEIDMTIFYRKLSTFNKTQPELFFAEVEKSSYLTPIELDKYKALWVEWLQQYGALLLTEKLSDNERSVKMNQINPKYVLRNYMAQLAIDDANKGSYGLINELFTMLKTPYDEQPDMDKWFVKRPDWAKVKAGCSMLSCSS